MSVFLSSTMIALVAIGAIQLLVVSIYVFAQQTSVKNSGKTKSLDLPDNVSFEPAVNVVLCLRGVDPFLDDCIAGLLAQNYSDFHLYCVLDRADDPAAQVVERFVGDSRLHSVVVQIRRDSCGLKNNALLTAIEKFQRQPEVIVSVDADALVDENWLRDLVAPLKDERVVASSGTRWFTASHKKMGSQVRHLWQLAALPQMYFYQVLWGGSLALKSDFALEHVAPVWETALFDDVMIGGLAKRAGKKSIVLPSLVVVNREEAALPDVTRWMTRQLLDTKLYLKQYPLIFGHSVLVPLLILALLAAMWWAPLAAGCSLAVYFATCFACWVLLHRGAAEAVAGRGLPATRPPAWWSFPVVGVLVTQWTYLRAAIRATLLKRVDWRGINYEVKGPHQIRMQEYLPFKEARGEEISSDVAESIS